MASLPYFLHSTRYFTKARRIASTNAPESLRAVTIYHSVLTPEFFRNEAVIRIGSDLWAVVVNNTDIAIKTLYRNGLLSNVFRLFIRANFTRLTVNGVAQLFDAHAVFRAFRPSIRLTNSYNGHRALGFDIGYISQQDDPSRVKSFASSSLI
jgi:hypothetical protein